MLISASQLGQSCAGLCNRPPHRGVHIYYENAQGEDLLDPAVKGSFKEEDIRLFYLFNGIKREVKNRKGTLLVNDVNYFSISKSTMGSVLKLSLNNLDDGGLKTT